jgi:hypothetical protein
MFKNIFGSKTAFWHLISTCLLFALATCVIMYSMIYFVLGLYFEEGHYPEKWNFYIKLLYLFSGVIILYPIILYRLIRNYKKGHHPKVKNYLVVMLVVLITTGFVAWNDLGLFVNH